MVVGVCRIVFSLPGNNSLKGKRSFARRILDRTRNRYNVAAAEVDTLDSKRTLSLGFAVVSNDQRHANTMLDAIVGFASTTTEAVVLSREIEILHLNEFFGGLNSTQDDFEGPKNRE